MVVRGSIYQLRAMLEVKDKVYGEVEEFSSQEFFGVNSG